MTESHRGRAFRQVCIDGTSGSNVPDVSPGLSCETPVSKCRVTRNDLVSMKSGASPNAADQVLVLCCLMGVWRRVKSDKGACWGSCGPIQCAENVTKRTERAIGSLLSWNLGNKRRMMSGY